MTWTKVPDSMPDDFLELSDAAFRLHVAATVYSNRIGLDGRIPAARVHLIPVPPRTRRASVIRELVGAGYWCQEDDGYVLTDFLRDQPSAEEVRLQRRWDVIRQQIRFAKGPDRAEKQADLRREADTVRDALQEVRNRRKATTSLPDSLVNHSVPLRPVPDPSRPAPSEDEDGDEAAAATRLGGLAAPHDEYELKRCVRCHRVIDDREDAWDWPTWMSLGFESSREVPPGTLLGAQHTDEQECIDAAYRQGIDLTVLQEAVR